MVARKITRKWENIARWIWVKYKMHHEIEGRPSVHVGSLRNEGLLTLEPGTLKDISVWSATFYIDHREWDRYEDLEMTAELQKSFAPRPEPERRTYVLRWGRAGVPFGSEIVEAIGRPRIVGKNTGLRWWWFCPGCSRLVTILYFGQDRWASWRLRCRTCYDLCYQSEKLTRNQRAMNRVFAGNAPIGSSSILKKLLGG